MERLTVKRNGVWHFEDWERGIDCTGKAVDRLAAYEDSGMEPEDMKRVFREDAILKLAGQALGTTADRLRNLLSIEKDGRLVVLPCKVEQLRKMLDDLTSGSSVDAGETYTTGYRYGWKNGRAELLRYIFGMSDGGTREAAEAALGKEG